MGIFNIRIYFFLFFIFNLITKSENVNDININNNIYINKHHNIKILNNTPKKIFEKDNYVKFCMT